MSKKIECAKIHLIRALMKLFYVFPINRNKVFFSSYEGKQFSCNPKYIFLEIRKCRPTLKYVYEYNQIDCIPSELKGVTTVKHNSFKYLFHILTAKIIVSNNAISPKIPIRNPQYVINTWHAGGAFKKVGIDIDSKINGMDAKMLELSALQLDLFLASSKGFYNGTGKGSCIPEDKVLYVGMPRNDIMFSDEPDRERLAKRVKNYYKIEQSERLLLYAPTFRGSIGSTAEIKGENLDWDQVKNALEERFNGKWRLMFRGHYHSKQCFLSVCDMIDASLYPDMQELLVAADALITDYSSVIWDYSLTGKPGFLYCPDLQEYSNERDFYSPIDVWPYSYAKNNHDLCDNIIKYNQDENEHRCNEYISLMNSFEDGSASKKVVKVILDVLADG